jgi:hypothetical protein
MSFPNASSIPNGNIRDLPDELLLQITQYLIVEPRFDRSAYGDLLSLAAANTRFPRVIQTTLQSLKGLTVPLLKVFTLFRTLRDFPVIEWADKIESLEITNYVSPEAPKDNYGGDEDGRMRMPWSSTHECRIQRRLRAGLMQYKDAQLQSKMPSRQFNVETDVTFRTNCLNAIRDADDVSNQNKRVWEDALRAGHNNAFLALLFLILPNLEELLLGGGHILHYPMLFRDADPWQGPMGPPSNSRCHWTNDTLTQQLREHKYLAQVFEAKYSRLTKLEMPCSLSGITSSRAVQIVPIYHHFDDLQTLIIAESALPPSHVVRSNGLLFSALPVTLRSLTIVDCTGIMTAFVRSLLRDTTVVPDTHLPNLRFIHACYYGKDGWYEMLTFADCAQAGTLFGILITTYFPKYTFPSTTLMASDVGGHPWKLSRSELHDISIKQPQDRSIREVAGHRVGNKQGRGHASGGAKEHFRNRRG